ncbi:MAG: hypothetical protein ACE37K_15780 [Planctomycetota bacterium]
MNTVRVDICYRPLRIAWAIRDGDVDAFRRAVRLSHALWGGRFNCIVIVDHDVEATRLIELFRVDLIVPLGESEAVRTFPARFKHIINPFFHDGLYIDGQGGATNCQALDIHNMLAAFHGTPELTALKDKGVRTYSWGQDDPLADPFLMLLGEYPTLDESHTDYSGFLRESVGATNADITMEPIPTSILEHPTIAHFSRHGVTTHHSVQRGWDAPGFYVGDATNLVDLVSFWNLRAADIPLWFVDPEHFARYTHLVPAWETRLREMVSRRHDFERRIAVWSRMDVHEARRRFDREDLLACPVSVDLWNGRNVRPPMMQLGVASALGVIGREAGRPKVSFALSDKPFCGDNWFHRQHLVASVSFFGGIFGDEQHTLNPPFIPELHEFYAREMHFLYDKLRVEPERVGLIIDAADSDTFLRALPIVDLMEKVFGMGRLKAKSNSAGHIARQIIASVGGIQGGRVLKIPGVRRLLKTHGPTASFTKTAALQLIGGRNPEDPAASFSDHADLHIESRASGTKLTAAEVFTYLVDRGLFRIGVELACPACRMSPWIPLDDLKQQAKCDLCGHEWNATRQLVDEKWHYRRSGALGVESNSLGAVPVVLTLQQLDANLHRLMDHGVYSTSLDLAPDAGSDVPKCEVDFVWIIPRSVPRKTVVLLGECKDQGEIDADTIDNLRRCADALPRNRFKTFIVLAKLAPFTQLEVELAKKLNGDHRQRAIMLTATELEPYHIYDRAGADTDYRAGTPEDLAQATARMYFIESNG